MASLTLRALRKQLGSQPILRGVDLDLRDGEFAVLVGPSGCGKSTLLRTVAGLEEPDSGSVRIGDRDVTRAAPRDRDVAMVFQSYALYPHLTVRENLSFGMRLRNEAPSTMASRVADVTSMLGLGDLLERYPRQLSGGQRQRVAMGRAIARRPALFLFDEPLSNLDAALRAQVRVEIRRMHDQLGATMVYVTHDQIEAMTLADRLVVLHAGSIEQQGAPLEVYRRPATQFVAGFLGSPAMNFVPARVSSDGQRIEAQGASVAAGPEHAGACEPGRDVILGVRPHDVRMGTVMGTAIEFVVDLVEAMGSEAFAHGTVGGVPFVARIELRVGTLAPRRGDVLPMWVAPESVHLFDPPSGHSLARTDRGANGG